VGVGIFNFESPEDSTAAANKGVDEDNRQLNMESELSHLQYTVKFLTL
jgi:hypothetical protein